MNIDSEKIINLKNHIAKKENNSLDIHNTQRNVGHKNISIDISVVFIG